MNSTIRYKIHNTQYKILLLLPYCY